MDNQDVLFQQLSDISNNSILIYDNALKKFQAKSFVTVSSDLGVGGGGGGSNTIAIAAFDQANTSQDIAIAAFDQANSSVVVTREQLSNVNINSYVVTNVSSFSGTTYVFASTSELVTINTSYLILQTDQIINCSDNAFPVTLTSAINNKGKTFIVKNSNASGSGNNINVIPQSGETIDSFTYVEITPLNSLTFVSDNANWIIV